MTRFKKTVFICLKLLFLCCVLSIVYYVLRNRDSSSKTSGYFLDTYKYDTVFSKGTTKAGWKPGKTYKMVDIEELHVSSNKDFTLKMKGSYRILHYNTELSPFDYAKDNHVIKNECSYTNCEFTSDLGQITQSHAVIFHLPKDGSRFTQKPPERKQDQVWILSDINPHEPTDLDIRAIDTTWRNMINWTMSYRFDSDIFWSHGTLRTRRLDEFPNKDYYVTFSYRKVKGMTLITDCHNYEAKGLKNRINYLSSRIKLDIDIYGDCKGTRRLPDVLSKVVLNYYYLFMFEEPICGDFLSKTFFEFFDLDVFLVVYGRPDFNKIIPNGILLNLAEFSHIDDEEIFTHNLNEAVEYVRRKDLYSTAPPVRWQCDLCQKLNNKGDNRRVYKSLAHVLESGVCTGSFLQLLHVPLFKIRTLLLVVVAIFMALIVKYRKEERLTILFAYTKFVLQKFRRTFTVLFKMFFVQLGIR